MKRQVTERELVAYLGGLLDPGEEGRIRAELQLSGSLRQQLAIAIAARQLAANVEAANDPPREARWHIPSPGAGLTAFGVRAQVQAAVFGGTAGPAAGVAAVVRPLGRFAVTLDPTAGDGWVIVLRERSDGWGVVFPPEKELSLRASELPERGGDRVVDLAVGARSGDERWCVAIFDGTIDWTLGENERWEELKARLAKRQVPVASLRLRVLADDDG